MQYDLIFFSLAVGCVQTCYASNTASSYYLYPDYIFYIDFEPDMDKEVNSNLMKSLEEFTLGVRNFGTYQQNLPDVINVSSPWKGLAEISAM